MAFVCLILYIVFLTLAPSEVMPVLAPLRLGFWPGVLGLCSGLLLVLNRGAGFLRLPQVWGLFGLLMTMFVSNMVADRWLGAPIFILGTFGVSVTMFLLIIWSVTSLDKLRKCAVAIVVSLSL